MDSEYRDQPREHVVSEQKPLKVARRNGADFVAIRAEDWEREQEPPAVLQNRWLMSQIARSTVRRAKGPV
ncbi:MAG: prevent-host-death protein [Pseudomonadota bacterium]|nr:prevent-host-death protein [Pseudomonadota bacterium]